MSEATRLGLWIVALAALLAAVLVPILARAQEAQSPCGPRAAVERELSEGGYTQRATGPDAQGNVVAWHQAASGAWAITVAPHGRDVLCVVATGPGAGAGK